MFRSIPVQASRPSREALNCNGSLLDVRGLTVELESPTGHFKAADEVSFKLFPGEILGIVGESGSGKSVTVSTLLGLTREIASDIRGVAEFAGHDLIAMRDPGLRSIRGRDIAMIFQDPMTSFNPVRTIGRQLTDAILVHRPEVGVKAAREETVAVLGRVGIPSPAARFNQYPHEFSGGMRQRAMIAMALVNQPRLLIADEATTALDVTIQAQILDLLLEVRETTGAAIVMITHDLGLLAEVADGVMVMYGGRVVERGDVYEIFNHPGHPYTEQLRRCLPTLGERVDRLPAIQGQPPMLTALPTGCAFHPRCSVNLGAACANTAPAPFYFGPDHYAVCHRAGEMTRLAASDTSEGEV